MFPFLFFNYAQAISPQTESHQAVQGLAPLGDHMRVDGLELLREGVEQAPDGTGSEFFMKGLPPVPDDFR